MGVGRFSNCSNSQLKFLTIKTSRSTLSGMASLACHMPGGTLSGMPGGVPGDMPSGTAGGMPSGTYGGRHIVVCRAVRWAVHQAKWHSSMRMPIGTSSGMLSGRLSGTLSGMLQMRGAPIKARGPSS